MMTNVGVIDRWLRLIVGLALLGWGFDYYGSLPDWGETAAKLVGAYPALTGWLRWDPVYALKDISTCAEES
jgi:hypothetical protein